MLSSRLATMWERHNGGGKRENDGEKDFRRPVIGSAITNETMFVDT